MTYTIAGPGSRFALTEEVNRLSREGWQCVGGVVIDRTEHAVVFYQAMVKPGDSPGEKQ